MTVVFKNSEVLSWMRRKASALAILALASTVWGGIAHAADDLQGVTPTEIRIGSSLIMSGPLKNFGISFKEGAESYFKQVNDKGGIHGRKIQYVVKDDGYNPDKQKQNVRQLLDEDRVFMLFGQQGTPGILATIPIAEQEGVPYFAPYSGNDRVHSPQNKMVFTTIASYPTEVERIVSHMKTSTLENVAVVYQNNAFGQPLHASAMKNLNSQQRKVVAESSVETDGSNAKAVAQQIADKKPRAVLMLTAGSVTSTVIKEYIDTGANAVFYLLSVADVEQLRTTLKQHARGLVIAQTLPPPWLPKIPLVSDYRKIYTSLLPDYSHFMGYVMARALVQTLQASGKNLSRSKYVATMRGSRFDLGGYVLDFSKGQQGSNYVDLTMLNAAGRYVR